MLRLLDPATWTVFEALDVFAARRALAALLEELDVAALSPEARATRDRRIVENARWLGLEPSSRAAAALLRRHLRLQALRRAEELIMLLGDVERMSEAGLESSTAIGLRHALDLGRESRGVVVLSAHLGPMAVYVPSLAYHLARKGARPELVSVMNSPSSPRLVSQIEDLTGAHGTRVRCLVKTPGNELGLLRELYAYLGRGAWVMLQIDVVSGGMVSEPLPFAGRSLRLPGAWGAAKLAARHRAPLLPVLARRTRSGRISLRVEPPIWPAAGQEASRSLRTEAARDTARALARQLEGWVLRDPADWALLPDLHHLIPGAS